MKKTSVLLVSTLLSVPCVESVAQIPPQPNATSIARPFLLDSTVRTRYYEIVAHFAEEQGSIYNTADDITDNLSFFDDLEFDSLAYVAMIGVLEDEWDIQLRDYIREHGYISFVGNLFYLITSRL